MTRIPSADFRVLGPLEVELDGRRVRFGTRRQRVLLGILLLDAGRLVPLDRLMSYLWTGQEPPRTARNAVQVCMSQLRASLGGGPFIVTSGDGYRIDPPSEAVDLYRFRSLVASAASQGSNALAALVAAEALWRGPVLYGTFDDALRERLCTTLDEERAAATARRYELELARGRHSDVVADLTALIERYPHHERLVELLMLALYRDGQAGRALQAYRRFTASLAEDLGISPGPALRATELAILRRSPRIDHVPQPGEVDVAGYAHGPLGKGVPPVSGAFKRVVRGRGVNGERVPPTRNALLRVRPASVTPAQLPPAVASFAGRRRELGRLDAILASTAATTGPVAVLSGTAGVGKSALAVHWAHRVRKRFPDGQLYVNLRGFDPSGSPMSPSDALRGFVDAFGVAPQQVPSTLDGQVALFRSLTANRRVLLLLDNARDAEQVRPLLPGAPGCVVVATSRNQLLSLVATQGVHHVPLDLLTPPESRELLALRVGSGRAAAEPDAVETISQRCAHLPLALAIVAARAAGHPDHPLSGVADEMARQAASLDSLDAGDALSDLRRVFSWSYESLSQPAARLFRLLGLHPDPDFGLPVAASLAGSAVSEVLTTLAELCRASLITQRPPARYSFHDLLHAYANELVEAQETSDDLHDAYERMWDHYLCTVHEAAELLHPARRPVAIPAPRSGVTTTEIADLDTAIAWFTAERRVLVSAVTRSASQGFDRHAWQLAWSMRDFLDRRRLWPEQFAVQQAGLEAARRLDDRSAQAYSHRSLGRVYAELGQEAEAKAEYRRGAELFAALGDRTGQAQVHMSMGMLAQRRGDKTESLHHHRQALGLFEVADDAAGRGNALNNIAMNYFELGEPAEALRHCTTALALIQQVGDRWGEASTWDSLGGIHGALGEQDHAVACYERALDLLSHIGDRYHESLILRHLADARVAAGDVAAAERHRQAALRILTELNHPEAAALRAELAH
jgi:DNA-binding SARP family transcriptional activator/tetratricopeptide (TPR) repeat protein